MRTTNDATQAVWTLTLPDVQRLLCHAPVPPACVVELARRGVHVDVVTRCDRESWPQSPRLRALWEPDPDVEYDAALLWEPATSAEMRAWVAAVQALVPPPAELAVWHRGGFHSWLASDARLRHAGFRLGPGALALPHPDRIRQLVAWEAWGRTPHVRHRRSHRAWKARIERSDVWRWFQPGRLRRATRNGRTPLPSLLDAILAAAGRETGATLHLERCLVSPNGVAIASVRLDADGASRNAILKIPYRIAASGRVARNAAGLEWVETHGASLGAWSSSAPRLLGRGTCGAWSYTLEEQVAGGEAQAWSDAAATDAMHHLTDFLAHCATLASAPAPLTADARDRFTRLATQRLAALMDADSARRLQAMGEALHRALEGVPVPLGPRHGDFKLENVLGQPFTPASLRVVDWELWRALGLPLLDAWHLVVSRRARRDGTAIGTALRAALQEDALGQRERRVLATVGAGLDARYVALAPILYWLDRVGPVAARGRWPVRDWEKANVLPMLEVAEGILAGAPVAELAGAVSEPWGGGR